MRSGKAKQVKRIDDPITGLRSCQLLHWCKTYAPPSQPGVKSNSKCINIHHKNGAIVYIQYKVWMMKIRKSNKPRNLHFLKVKHNQQKHFLFKSGATLVNKLSIKLYWK